MAKQDPNTPWEPIPLDKIPKWLRWQPGSPPPSCSCEHPCTQRRVDDVLKRAREGEIPALSALAIDPPS